MNMRTVAHVFADKLSRAGLLSDEDINMLTALNSRKDNRRRWTAQEDRTLQRLRLQSSIPQVADKLGRTPESVKQRLKKMRRKERVNG